MGNILIPVRAGFGRGLIVTIGESSAKPAPTASDSYRLFFPRCQLWLLGCLLNSALGNNRCSICS